MVFVSGRLALLLVAYFFLFLWTGTDTRPSWATKYGNDSCATLFFHDLIQIWSAVLLRAPYYGNCSDDVQCTCIR